VRIWSGVAKVEAIRLRPDPEPVYNLEVEGDHCYRVGESGVLAHNASPGCNPCERTKRLNTSASGNGGTFAIDAEFGTDADGRIFTYKTADLKSSGDGSDDDVVCRVHSIKGTITGLRPTQRTGTPQDLWNRLMTRLSVSGQDAGHLAAVEFGGPDSVSAIVPMNSSLNKAGGSWWSMERRITRCLGQSDVQILQYSVTVQYSGEGIVPRGYTVVMRFSGSGAGERNRLVFPNSADAGSFAQQNCFSQWSATRQ
jgi:hypothetical protein